MVSFVPSTSAALVCLLLGVTHAVPSYDFKLSAGGEAYELKGNDHAVYSRQKSQTWFGDDDLHLILSFGQGGAAVPLSVACRTNNTSGKFPIEEAPTEGSQKLSAGACQAYWFYPVDAGVGAYSVSGSLDVTPDQSNNVIAGSLVSKVKVFNISSGGYYGGILQGSFSGLKLGEPPLALAPIMV